VFHEFTISEEQRRDQLALLIESNAEITEGKPIIGICVVVLDKKARVAHAKFLGRVAISLDSLHEGESVEVSSKPFATLKSSRDSAMVSYLIIQSTRMRIYEAGAGECNEIIHTALIS
jgi:hypothetical protein